MILAELQVYQSRPIAPTRRVALGRRTLPVAPAPGFGGLLLAGITAAFASGVDDPDLARDLVRLTHQVERGQRIAQPRLRHRFQTDHVGLNSRVHRLVGSDERVTFDFDRRDGVSAVPQVLGAVYAVGELEPEARPAVMAMVRRGLTWNGPVDATLVEYLAGRIGAGSFSPDQFQDPVEWALGVLGLGAMSGRGEVQRAFRELLRQAHPDHGAAAEGAADRIADLTEARRILLAG